MKRVKAYLETARVMAALSCIGVMGFIWYLARFNDLTRAADAASVILAIVVAISVIFIWKQLSQQTRLTKVANTQALVDLSAPFSIQLIQDRRTAELWVKGAREFEHFDEVDRHCYIMLLYWWLIFHENVFYQKQNDLLDHHIYASWAYDLKNFIKKQNLKAHWGELRASFQPEFCEHIDRLIESNPCVHEPRDVTRLKRAGAA